MQTIESSIQETSRKYNNQFGIQSENANLAQNEFIDFAADRQRVLSLNPTYEPKSNDFKNYQSLFKVG